MYTYDQSLRTIENTQLAPLIKPSRLNRSLLSLSLSFAIVLPMFKRFFPRFSVSTFKLRH